ncbi:MAG: type I CRISPR-associated protein Cas7 [Methanobacteriaceae archaeon]|nr:type I CRISPR-associated protein Cas7 [Methanobacteriaceae archaeon]
MSKEFVNNYYQGIYVTETVMGNPNGDFIDNSPRNFDGKVFTTDKCIKYNIRKYIHETIEDVENKKNIVFFYPRLVDDAKIGDSKFQTSNNVFKSLFENDFENLKNNSPDIRMFGGTFSFKNNSKQIYGPIQLSYGIDINEAEIKRLNIGSPFATNSGQQTTLGSEAVVDDAIISYDITINPNSHPDLLLKNDLELFKKSLWFGTNSRKSTSKKTDSKLLILIKFKNISENKVTCINMGELKNLISINDKSTHKLNNEIIDLNTDKLNNKLKNYSKYIESIDVYSNSDEIKVNLNVSEDITVNCYKDTDLLG